MPISIDMAPLLALPEEERREIAEELLESVDPPELTDELKAELARRMAHLDAHPEDLIPWEQVRDAARERRGRAISPR
jgi:putative addiction module component (TIGR02574 family)